MLSLLGGDRNALRITQWLEPFNAEAPYATPINHISINRIALAVKNLDSAVAALTEEGVQFLSKIAPCCSGTGADRVGIINALDPDGVFVELVGAIAPRPPEPEAEVCSSGGERWTPLIGQ